MAGDLLPTLEGGFYPTAPIGIRFKQTRPTSFETSGVRHAATMRCASAVQCGPVGLSPLPGITQDGAAFRNAVPIVERECLNTCSPCGISRLAKINYRFHGGALRQIEVKYKPTQIPGGYESLVQRLTDVYGRPQEDNGEQWDPRPDVLSLRKTVWTNATTQIAVTETRRIQPGDEPSNDLVLTMTDRALEEAYQEEQLRRRHQEMSHIPIPLPDAGLVSKRNGKRKETADVGVRPKERLFHSQAGL